ncbi:carbohydrate sulfotransferase 7 [Bombina bombina]|uniref:carbohydrate sulfotransferase 7 n=1 Tax=Bombina bombina TaxID=8345 RepID=UPI00235A5544|nr:carbohydrate sulfotransferase 7 [Bombina bombina]
MKKRKAKKLWWLLLVYAALLLLLLFSLLMQEGGGGSSRGDREERIPLRPCPNLETSLWEQDPVLPEVVGSPPPRTHIYLHATWRTGSSFIGEIFNQHPQVFYLYEPAWHMWQSLYPGDAESLQGALRDLLASLFRCDFSVLRLYAASNLSTAGVFGSRSNKVMCSAPLCSAGKPRERVGLVESGDCEKRCPGRPLWELEKECRRYPVMVIKDVRLLDMSVLRPLLQDPALNLHIVQLFRDPRAVHNSRLRSKRSLLRESLQVLRSRARGGDSAARAIQQKQLHRGGTDYLLSGAMEIICQAWLRDLLLLRRGNTPPWLNQRYLRLRYEDIVLRPQEELRRLLRFSGLSAKVELEEFVMNMTRGSGYSSERPFEVSARDAREALAAWRERLSREQVHKVEEACGEAMTVLGYKPDTLGWG